MGIKNQEYCTLSEALHWIAYKAESEDLSAEFLFMHQDKLKTAEQKFKFYVSQRKLEILAQKKIKPTGYAAFMPTIQARMPSELLEPEKTLEFMEDRVWLDTATNSIIYKNNTYKNIKVSCGDLLKIYPDKKQALINDDNDFYKSDYMQLMIDVIIQHGINEENPLKVEALKQIITDEMRNRHLPESNKLASAMATLIRPLNAQGGRKKMG